MLGFLRTFAVTAVLIAAASSSVAGEKESLSQLTSVALKSSPAAVVITLVGSKAPDFTSFTMSDPFRVVVDWAGSRLVGVSDEKSFDHPLIRRITTKQYDSEAEKISRVTVELVRETSYHVEAAGKRVLVHFTPVADPIPTPPPAPAPEPAIDHDADAKAKAKPVASAIPEGPLTEPAIPVPSAPPPMAAPKKEPIALSGKATPAKTPEPATAQTPAKSTVAAAQARDSTQANKDPSPARAEEPAKRIASATAPAAAQSVNVATAEHAAKPNAAGNAGGQRDASPQVAGNSKSPASASPQLAGNSKSPASASLSSAKATAASAPIASAADSKNGTPSSGRAVMQADRASEPAPGASTPPTAVAAHTNPSDSARKSGSPPQKDAMRLASFPGVAPDAKPVASPDKGPAKPGPAMVETPAASPERRGSEPPARIASAAQPTVNRGSEPATRLASTAQPSRGSESPTRIASAAQPPTGRGSAEPPTRFASAAQPPTSRRSAEAPMRFASAAQPTTRGSADKYAWHPPSIEISSSPTRANASATRPPPNLPVVRVASAQSEPLKPSSTTPADADEPKRAKSSDKPVSAASDANDFDPGRRVMKYIGFRQMADVSRVFVRLDGKARYKESREGSTMVLELANTTINVKNNERALDTTYFNSAVSKVQAVRAGENTRVEVKLREVVPYKVTRMGTTIAIDFKRSGS